MDKETLLKRIRLWATVITSTFVVLIVTLVIQFGVIAYRTNEINRLKATTSRQEEQLESIQKEQAFYANNGKDAYIIQNGYQPK